MYVFYFIILFQNIKKQSFGSTEGSAGGVDFDGVESEGFYDYPVKNYFMLLIFVFK